MDSPIFKLVLVENVDVDDQKNLSIKVVKIVNLVNFEVFEKTEEVELEVN